MDPLHFKSNNFFQKHNKRTANHFYLNKIYSHKIQELPNYFKGHSLNTPRNGFKLKFREGLKSMVQKERQKEFYLQWETWRRKKRKTNHLTSRGDQRTPCTGQDLELAEFRSWGYKGTSSKIISLFHKCLRRKRTINTLKRQLLSVSLDQRSWLVNTMVTLNWVRRLERAQ